MHAGQLLGEDFEVSLGKKELQFGGGTAFNSL